MFFYNQNTSEVLSREELVARYGTEEPIPQLSIISADDARAALLTKISLLDAQTTTTTTY